jgi:uncharacterized membrane-anchored protein YhcB (DUF1043 family)
MEKGPWLEVPSAHALANTQSNIVNIITIIIVCGFVVILLVGLCFLHLTKKWQEGLMRTNKEVREIKNSLECVTVEVEDRLSRFS